MAMAASTMEVDQDLPGFRFHPTEEELLGFYLSRVALGKKLHFDIIGTLNIYRHDPWDLPGMAKIGEREWHFFVPRDRKAGNGGRPNRTTERGFWKATGSDRAIRSTGDPKRVIGLKKTLVFYQGRAPRGTKTDWVMNEYRLPDTGAAPPSEDTVLCKVYRKATPLKELEQRAFEMEEMKQRPGGNGGAARACPVPAAGDFYLSSSDDVQDNFLIPSSSSSSSVAPSGNSSSHDAPREAKKEADAATVTVASTSSLPQAANAPFHLQLPAVNSPCGLQLPAANHGMSNMSSLQLPAASQRSDGNGGYDYSGAARACPVPAAGDFYLSSSDDVQDNFLILSSSSSSSVAPSGNCSSHDAPRVAKKEADVSTATVASTSSLPQAANAPFHLQLPAVNPPCGLQLPAANHGMSNMSSLQLPAASQGVLDLPNLQLPAASSHGVFDWLNDPFLTQLRSPWQDQHCMSPYAHLLY